MSPIYVRPEREQAEHDRLIRFLQQEYGQKVEAFANPGDEKYAPVKLGGVIHFPDLVLSADKRLAGLIEIETAASVNNLETMAKWVPFSRARVPFHLYVPVQGYEAALRLAEAHRVKAAEIWTYRPAVEGFDLVRMFADPVLQKLKPVKTPVVARSPAAPAAGDEKAPTDQPEAAAAPVEQAKSKAMPAPKGAKKIAAKTTAVKKTATKPARAAKPAKAVKKAARPVPARKKAAPKAKVAARKATKPARKATRPARKVAKASSVRKAVKRKAFTRKHR